MLVKDLVEELLSHGEDFEVSLELDGDDLDFQLEPKYMLNKVIINVNEDNMMLIDTREYEDLEDKVVMLDNMVEDLKDYVKELEDDAVALQEEIDSLSE